LHPQAADRSLADTGAIADYKAPDRGANSAPANADPAPSRLDVADPWSQTVGQEFPKVPPSLSRNVVPDVHEYLLHGGRFGTVAVASQSRSDRCLKPTP
jgi:hypothetical protein